MPTMYELHPGLAIERTIIRPGDEPEVQQLHIGGEIFAPEPLYGRPVSHVESVTASHQTLSAQVISRETGRLAIHSQIWGGNADNHVTAHDGRRLAQALPGHTVMNLTMPGHGQAHRTSAPWPTVARLEMLTKGSFTRAGTYLGQMLPSFAHLHNASEGIDVLGTSTGGRSAIALASALKLPVGNLVLFDAPGSADHTLRGFMNQYGRIEGQHAERYKLASRDPQYQELMSTAPSRLNAAYAIDLLKKRRRTALDFYVSEIRALSKDRLRQELTEVDLSNVARIVFLSPSQSSLNNPHNVRTRLEAASAAQPDTQFEHYTFRGSHMITRSASTVLGALYKAALVPKAHAR